MQRKYNQAAKYVPTFSRSQPIRKRQDNRPAATFVPGEQAWVNPEPFMGSGPYTHFVPMSIHKNQPVISLVIPVTAYEPARLSSYSMLTEPTSPVQSPLPKQKPFMHYTIHNSYPYKSKNRTEQPIVRKLPEETIVRKIPSEEFRQLKLEIHKVQEQALDSSPTQHRSPAKLNAPNAHTSQLPSNPLLAMPSPLSPSSGLLPISMRQTSPFRHSMIIQDNNPSDNIMEPKSKKTTNSAYLPPPQKKSPLTKAKNKDAMRDNENNNNFRDYSSIDFKKLLKQAGMASININDQAARTHPLPKKYHLNFIPDINNHNIFSDLKNPKKYYERQSISPSITNNLSTGNLVKFINGKLMEKEKDTEEKPRKTNKYVREDRGRKSQSPSLFSKSETASRTTHKPRKYNDCEMTAQQEQVPGFIQKKVKEGPRAFTADDFEIIQKLGKGAYGDVFLARQQRTHFVCVLKALSKKRMKELSLENHVFREIKIQSYLTHRHITNLYGVFDDQHKIYLIMECMPDSSMHSNGKKKISQSEAAHLIAQTCDGLLYIHRENIIHRDIKPENLLLNDSYVKIADFGCSVFGNTMRNTVVGSYAYISPEQFSNSPYDDKIDSWSVGVLTYEMLIGRPPYEEQLHQMALKGVVEASVQRMQFPEVQFPQGISMEAMEFIRRLLDKNPQRRADMREALRHKFILKAKQYQKYLQSQLQSKL